GRAHTKVESTVGREGGDKPIELELERGRVSVETVMGVRRKADDTWDFMLDEKNKIGYIRLTQFGPDSAKDMEAAVKDLEKQGVKGVVLDVRFNPGGLLSAAGKISDPFLGDGLIVSGRRRVWAA